MNDFNSYDHFQITEIVQQRPYTLIAHISWGMLSTVVDSSLSAMQNT